MIDHNRDGQARMRQLDGVQPGDNTAGNFVAAAMNSRMSKGDIMRLLLTSAGIKNRSIRQALLDMLGKPIAECDALCIPTAGYGHPQVSPVRAYRFISGQ